MLPYYIFLALLLPFTYLSGRNPKSKFYLLSIYAVMVLFAGLRSDEIGTDAAGYARSFLEGRKELEGDWIAQATDEAGFYYLNFFLRSISTEYVVLFMGIALLTYACILTSVRRETNKLMVPLFVFVTLGLYTFVFNAARQGIAVAIYMLSFKYLFENGYKSLLKYTVVVLIAALFHKTVVIAIPLYFLFRIPYSPKMLGIIGLMGAAIGGVLPAFLEYAGEMEVRYNLYSTSAGGGELLTLFFVLITAFFIFWRRNIDQDYIRHYDTYLNMMLFGTLIYAVVQFYDVYIEVTRFAAYFQVASIFLWAFIYQSKNRPSSLLSTGVVVGHLLYYFIFCSRMANLTPYLFNPNL